MLKVTILAVLLAGLSLVLASNVDFKTPDFVAAAPFCYHHSTGGGAFNDDTSGKNRDTVESLEGKDFKCGDIISYLLVIKMEDQVVDAKQGLRMKVSFLADPTGQTGVGFGNLAGVSINKPGKPVENGNGFTLNINDPSASQPDNRCLGFGTDGGAWSNGDEEVIIESRALTAPIFTQGATLEAVIVITNLEAKERVIVRIDVFIYCLPGSRPTGNLQGDILWKVSTADFSSIGGGQQTIPLLGVGGVQGIDCTELITPLVGNDFTADVKTYTTDGGIVLSTFKFSWAYGAYSLENAGSGTFELHTFDTYCSFLHSGEYLYSRSECGCESTKIGADQPQFFFNASGEYYSPDVLVIDAEEYTGLKVNRYTSIGTGQTIKYLYLDFTTGRIVRVDWTDGRTMIFANVVSATFTAADFATPTIPCTCRRRTDIALVLERSETIPSTDLAAMKLFASGLVGQFQIDPDHNQFTVMTYGAEPLVRLGINAGTSLTNIRSAIGAITCDGSGQNGPCGPGTDGDVVKALDAAVAELKKSTRSFVGRAVVFVTDGWVNPSASVIAAVQRAVADGAEVFVVSFQTTMLAIDLDDLVSNPDYLIQRFSLENLGSLDPIDVSSRLCLINEFPCGAFCCGVCDTACGQCKAVDACPVVQGCAYAFQKVDLCCVNVTVDTCPDKNATCEVGSCNAATNACVYTPTCAPPAGGDNCYDYNCVATNGSCVKTPKFTSNQCIARDCVNNAIVETPTVCPTSDRCTTWTCDPVRGCVSAPVLFTGTPTTQACRVDVCDPAQGWIVSPIPGCSSTCTLNCGVSDRCATRFCTGTVGNYSCSNTSVACDAPNLCYNATCNPATGCSIVEKTCDDNNACTVDSCDVATGGCKYEPIVCTSTDLCVPAVCNNQTGACESIPKACNDGVGCTLDSCNSTTGNCQFVPNDAICDLQDPCNTYSCDAVTGCKTSKVTCPDDGLFCTEAVCVAFQGCNNQSLSCNNTATDVEDCSTVECREEEEQCVKTEQDCAVVIIATTVALSAGIIAGIVVGVVAFIACAGGASYAVFQNVGAAGTTAVVNNPLYQGEKRNGENPLFQPK